MEVAVFLGCGLSGHYFLMLDVEYKSLLDSGRGGFQNVKWNINIFRHRKKSPKGGGSLFISVDFMDRGGVTFRGEMWLDNNGPK